MPDPCLIHAVARLCTIRALPALPEEDPMADSPTTAPRQEPPAAPAATVRLPLLGACGCGSGCGCGCQSGGTCQCGGNCG